MSVLLLIVLYFSRYRMKERHQKVQIRTSQKPKKETRLKTRVNSCTRSHKENKRKTENPRLEKAFEFQLRVQTKL